MVTINAVGDFINGSIDNKRFSLKFNADIYNHLRTFAEIVNQSKSVAEYKENLDVLRTEINELIRQEQSDDKRMDIENLSFEFRFSEGQTYLYYQNVRSRLYIPTILLNKMRKMDDKGISFGPFLKFFIRALRPHKGHMMTQQTMDGLADYIMKTYVDEEMVTELMCQGFSRDEAVARSTFNDTFITEEGLLGSYKVVKEYNRKDDTHGWNDGEDSEYEVEDNLETCDDSLPGCDDCDNDDENCWDNCEFKDDCIAAKKSGATVVPAKVTSWTIEGRTYGEKDLRLDKEGKTFIQLRTVKGGFGSKYYVENAEKGAALDEATALTVSAEERVWQPPVMGMGGDAFYSGDTLGHTIQIGQVVRLENWSQVNLSHNANASKGLHIGGLAYIRSFGASATPCETCRRQTLNIFVDPAHIGAIANYDNALRVIQYFPHSAMVAPNRGMYHSSSYARMVDEEWKGQVELAFDVIKVLEEQLAAEKAKVANHIPTDF